VRTGPDDGSAAPADEVRTTVLGTDPSPLAVLEGTASLLEMDRGEIGTPLGDLEALSPR
jgi:hypothetical protein